jgi:hypothetical protein
MKTPTPRIDLLHHDTRPRGRTFYLFFPCTTTHTHTIGPSDRTQSGRRRRQSRRADMSPYTPLPPVSSSPARSQHQLDISITNSSPSTTCHSSCNILNSTSHIFRQHSTARLTSTATSDYSATRHPPTHMRVHARSPPSQASLQPRQCIKRRPNAPPRTTSSPHTHTHREREREELAQHLEIVDINTENAPNDAPLIRMRTRCALPPLSTPSKIRTTPPIPLLPPSPR